MLTQVLEIWILHPISFVNELISPSDGEEKISGWFVAEQM